MPRFSEILDSSNNPQLKALYEDIVNHGYRESEAAIPPNWFTTQGERPDILASIWKLGKGIATQGELPSSLKEMIMTIISMQNNCRYCTAAHRKMLEESDVPQAVIDGLTQRNLSKVNPIQRAVLEFSLKAAQSPQSVLDEDVEKLREFGLGDGEILEIIMTVAYTNFINTWSDMSGISFDGE